MIKSLIYMHSNVMTAQFSIQVKMCYHDLRSALTLSPSCPEAGALLGQLEEASERARQQAVSRALAGELTEALSKINTALENCPETGRHYLFRC